MRDLIDRQAAIDAVGSMLRRKFGIGGDLAEITLTDLPSAQQNLQLTCNQLATDSISRQAAIDVADAVWSVTGDKNVAKVWDQIKDLPSAQPEQRWIPVSERLPEEYGNYLISIDGEEPDIGTINPNDPRGWSLCDANGFYWASDKALNITAWMPLPEPYKKENR